jgi:hypothetical protein
MSAEEVTALAGCLVAVATVLGVFIAAYGLKTWRNQVKGAAQFELARRLLLDVYRLRDAIEGVRHPLMLISEADGADTGVPWEVSVYDKRWRRVMNVWTQLDVCIYECRILWNKEISELVQELRSHQKKLYLAVRAFCRAKQEESDAGLSENNREVLYGLGDDPFGAELRSTVDKFEKYVRPHLMRN